MIDLHCHLLPGVDDGPPDYAVSAAMATAALADGIEAIVATPHVSMRYRTDPLSIAGRAQELEAEYARRGVGLRVLPGAEVSLSLFSELSDDEVRACRIAGGPYLLLEPSYSSPMPFLGQLVFQLGLQGIRPLLAHPERAPAFQRDPAQVEALVNQGAACVVSVGSVTGQFGGTVKKFTWSLLEQGLVHAIASDAHDPAVRAPRLREPLAGEPMDDDAVEWFTRTAPEAIVAGERLPGAPPRVERRRRFAFRRR